MSRRSIAGNCVICGIWRETLHRDHILAKKLGGSDDLSNIQLICANCHEDKTRLDMSLIMSGRKLSESHRANIGAGNRGGIRSEETRAKMSESGRRSWRNSNEERRANAVIAAKNRTLSQESRAKIRAAMRGKPLSEAHKVKISAALQAYHKTA